MDLQELRVCLKSLYSLLFILPLILADCANRACFPPSPDLVSQQYRRAVAVTSTCGDPPGIALVKLTEVQVTCNSSDPDLTHNVENVYDDYNRLVAGLEFIRPVLVTWWQSQNSAENVILSLSLGDTFLFQTTLLVFRSLRPSSLIIEKSDDHRQTWLPLRYYARSCSESFPGVTFLAPDAFEGNQNIVSGCMQRYYHGDTDSFDNSEELQQVVYNPVRELGARFYEKPVLELFRFTDLRINLVKPGSSDTGRDYFAVADWSVIGHCLCYGHAEECNGQNEARCFCEHNTMGQHCDECLPLYNNKPWAVAYMNNPNECEDCGCNGRASSCIYNEVKGYGVCDNCTENSTGDKCDHCIEQFFNDPSIEENSFCIACNCTLIGSVGSLCNETDGQCVCRANVQGRQCEECKDSYHNLQGGNSEGCQICECDPRGTEGAPNLCDKVTGQCICKINIEGRRCNQCRPGFFNLTLTNPEGCTPCDCNGGGALSNTCNNLTGLCDCKMNIGGRSCDIVQSGFYVPLLDGIKVEPELMTPLLAGRLLERPETAVPKGSGRGLLIIPELTSVKYPSLLVPRTQRYDVVIRYNVPSLSSNNQLFLSAPNNTNAYSCADGGSILEPPVFNFNLSATPALSAVSIGHVCLAAGVLYEPRFVSGSSGEDALAIDALILLPVLADLSIYLESGNDSLSIESCRDSLVSDGLLQSDGNCSKIEFLVMAELYNGAIECNCNVNGSINTQECEPLGGQCRCLPGVAGQACQYCSAYHYNLLPAVGCQACGCDSFGSQEQSCYLRDGVCDCRTNVTGDKCNQCAAEHYGLSTGLGCTPCGCDPGYSLHNQCNDTGQCQCKPGVGQVTCTACLPGFFSITTAGCNECRCNPLGSRMEICSAVGQCDCLEAATGLRCNTCPENTFGFGPYSERGCLDCVCSGHSINCSMATDWYTYTLTSSWSLFDLDVSPEWTGETGSGDAILINTRPILEVQNPRFILEAANTDSTEELFFVSPEVYQGDFRAAYGQMLYFTLSQTTVDNQTISLDGDVFLYGLFSEEPLVTQLLYNPGLKATQYSIKLHEHYWGISNVSGIQPDMVYMVRILSALHRIKIRAKYTQLTDNSVFLHEVKLEHASDHSDLSSNPPAEFVEQCQCPHEYSGQFCESCVLGYRWDEPLMGPFSECVRCDCNSHSLIPCHVRSGLCINCTHNTAGDFCEICADGYYGNATVGSSEDCQPCMCPGPSGFNSFAGTCNDDGVCQGCAEGHGGLYCEHCLPGYYGEPADPQNNGGLCRQCFCNLSPPDCNSTTGYCNSCIGNTFGPTCGECQFSYYGNIDNCLVCNCNMTGSHGNCSDTGVCECLPNVTGITCTECVVDTWGFDSGLGCSSCNCHPVGTVSNHTQCHQTTGQCECKDLVTGLNCDMCRHGYWSVQEECRPCECNLNGTDLTTCIDGQCSCDQITGQCTCRMPSIAGRRCDQCGRVNEDISEVAEVFVGLFPNCEPCPECFHNWREVLSEHITTLSDSSTLLEGILGNYGNISLQLVDAQLLLMRDKLSSFPNAHQKRLIQEENLSALQRQFKQVFDEVVSLNDNLATALVQQLILRQAVQQLAEFDGSVTIVGTSDTVSAQHINSATLPRKSVLDNLYQNANVSWFNIQQFYEMCVAASVQAASLVSDVDGLMYDVNRSIQQRLDTNDALNDAQQLLERAQNNQRISEIEDIHLSIDLETSVRDVMLAEEQAMAAHNISIITVGVAEREFDETRVLSTEAGIASTNTSRAEQLVASTHSKSQSYKMLALSIQANASLVYSDLLSTLFSLNGTAESLTDATSLLEATQQYSVRPFTDMAAIVSQINTSQLQGDDVTILLQDSKTQSESAEIAFNATSMAYHEAEMVPAHLQSIEYSLEEGRRVANMIEDNLAGLIDDWSNIQTVIHEVQRRASQEVERSNVLLDDISVLDQLSQSTEQCYRDTATRGQTATDITHNSYSRLAESYNVMATVSTNKQELDSAILSESQVISDGTLVIEQFSDSIQTTEQKLINIQQEQNINNLISKYQARRVEMERLLTDLNQMETNLDQILANLDGTDGTSLQCKEL